MKKEYSLAIIISMAVHAAIIVVIVFFKMSPEVPLGDGVVSIDIIGEGDDHNPTSGGQIKGVGHALREKGTSLPSSNGDNTNAVNGSGTGNNYGSPSGNPILAEIRNKIERAKYYPPIAKQRGEEGKPLVSFQINSDGSLAHVKVTRTSGNKMLDDAAVDTIKRAVPYPFYSDEISLAIKFSLE